MKKMTTMSSNEARIVALPKIKQNGNLRAISEDKVIDLMDSIKMLGLLNPLILSCDGFLLAGVHRYIACDRLGLTEIACTIKPFKNNTPEAKLLRIDENLQRNELTALEQGEQLVEREKILKTLDRRAQSGWNRNQHTDNMGDEIYSLPKRTEDLAREMGISKKTAQNRKQMINGLTEAHRDQIRGTKLANQPSNLLRIAKIKDPERKQRVIDKMLSDTPPETVNIAIKEVRIEAGEISNEVDIIKPTNWWGIGTPFYTKDPDFDGSIPGEIYANALYYWAPQTGIAVDLMAGSGMLRRVYDDRSRWQKDRDFELDVRLFDLYPRSSFVSRYQIKKHNARDPLPFKADWLFLDPPYFRQSAHLYDGELAQTEDYTRYCNLIFEVVQAAYESLNTRGILCFITNPYITWDGDFIDVPFDSAAIARRVGFTPVFSVAVNRCEQSRRGGGYANLKAKRLRQMYSDCSTLLVFKKEAKHG
jgi:uncharacterized ParB-like nuclease family protein